MIAQGFLVFLVLPSMAFIFAILATFYGGRRAFIAISWVPLSLFLIIYAFRWMIWFMASSDAWLLDLSRTVGVISLLQFFLGIALIVRAFARRQDHGGLYIATCFTGLPFILWVLSR